MQRPVASNRSTWQVLSVEMPFPLQCSQDSGALGSVMPVNSPAHWDEKKSHMTCVETMSILWSFTTEIIIFDVAFNNDEP